jgi:hypothetical protein
MEADQTGRTVSGAYCLMQTNSRKAAEALSWARGTLTRLGLTLDEAKTSIRNARQERFDFLSYTFGPHFSRRTGRKYLGYSPDPGQRVSGRPRLRLPASENLCGEWIHAT